MDQWYTFTDFTCPKKTLRSIHSVHGPETVDAKAAVTSVQLKRKLRKPLPFLQDIPPLPNLSSLPATMCGGKACCMKRLDKENRNGLSHYQKLQAALADAVKEVRTDATVNQGAVAKILRYGETLEWCRRLHRFPTTSKYYNEIRPRNSIVAQKAFDVHEILEMILLNATVSSVITMERVSSSLRATIAASPKLQIKLCLKPRPQPVNAIVRYRSPFETALPGTLVVYTSDDKRSIKVSMSRQDDGNIPKFTNRKMKMFVSQPPVKELRPTRACAGCGLPDRGTKFAKVRSEAGFTVGELYEHAKEIFSTAALHRSCGATSEAKYVVFQTDE